MLPSLVAPVGLDGASLVIAKAVAQWAFMLGPIASISLWVFGSKEDRAAAVTASAVAAIALAAACVVSTLIFVPRPFMDGAAVNYLDHARDSSFPSDHATLVFALSFAFWLRRPPGVPRIYLQLMVLGLAVGWARVFLNAHYPSDIAGGALVAALAAGAGASAPGRLVVRPLIATGELARSGVVAGWRRFGPIARSSGVPEP